MSLSQGSAKCRFLFFAFRVAFAEFCKLSFHIVAFREDLLQSPFRQSFRFTYLALR